MSEDSEKRAQRRRVRQWWQAVDADLPTDFTPLEAVVTIKGIDGDANVCLFVRKTSGVSVWEAFGMLSYALDDYSSATTQCAVAEEDE